MKPIRKDELYDNLSQFLKRKGVELKEGPYTKGVHAGCSMLADAINLSQAGLERAKVGLERGMDQVRQVIHEKTAPKTAPHTEPASGGTRGKSKIPASKEVGGKRRSRRGRSRK